MLISAEKAPWHYILLNGDWDQSLASCRTVGGRATPVARRARLAAGRGVERRRKRLPSCSTSVSVSDNIGPGAAFCCVAVGSWLAQIGDAVLELLFQHEGKETARDVAANGLVELMKDRPRGEQALRRSEGPFHPP